MSFRAPVISTERLPPALSLYIFYIHTRRRAHAYIEPSYQHVLPNVTQALPPVRIRFPSNEYISECKMHLARSNAIQMSCRSFSRRLLHSKLQETLSISRKSQNHNGDEVSIHDMSLESGPPYHFLYFLTFFWTLLTCFQYILHV